MSEMVADKQENVEEFQQFIRSLDPGTVGLYQEAALGRDARSFASSTVGRYMIGCAKQDAEEAREKLSRVLPWRWRKVQQLQNEIRVAEMFLSHLRDLAVRGKAAENALQEKED